MAAHPNSPRRKGGARLQRRRRATAGLVSNIDVEVSPAERASRHNQDLINQAIERTKRSADAGFSLEVQRQDQALIVRDELLGQSARDIASARYLVPLAIVEDASWPDGTGLRKDLNKEQWDAMLQHGLFCFRCRNRLGVPFLWKCESCGWTQDLTAQAVELLYERRFLSWMPAAKMRRAA